MERGRAKCSVGRKTEGRRKTRGQREEKIGKKMGRRDCKEKKREEDKRIKK